MFWAVGFAEDGGSRRRWLARMAGMDGDKERRRVTAYREGNKFWGKNLSQILAFGGKKS